MPSTDCGRSVKCGDLVDVEIGGVGGEHGAGLAVGIELAEHLALDADVLEHRLDHHVGVGDLADVGGAVDQAGAGFDILRAHAAALGGGRVILGDQIEAALQGIGAGLDDRHRDAGIGEAHRDAAAHGAGADHRGVLHVDGLHVLRQVGDLRGLALGKEDVALRLRLRAFLQFDEGVALADQRFGDRHVEGPAQGLQRFRRRMQAAGALGIRCGEFVELGRVGAQVGELVVAVARAGERTLFGDHALRK